MNAGIQQRSLHAPVDTDEMKEALGEDLVKVLLVVSKTGIIGNVSSSASTMVPSGTKEAPVSAETQAWLLSREAQEIETKFRDARNQSQRRLLSAHGAYQI